MYKEFSEKYPLLFSNKNEMLPINLFGIECGEGWKDVLDISFRLIYRKYNSSKRDLEFWEKNNKHDPVIIQENITKAKEQLLKDEQELPIVEQIKEKFGTLRIYCYNVSKYAEGVFDMAESLSGMTCEKCGARGTQTGSSWIITLCKSCKEKHTIN